MRLQTVGPPVTRNGRTVDPKLRRHRSCAPCVAASGLLSMVNATSRATSILTGGAPRGRIYAKSRLFNKSYQERSSTLACSTPQAEQAASAPLAASWHSAVPTDHGIRRRKVLSSSSRWA
jgi:hypothetical protein